MSGTCSVEILVVVTKLLLVVTKLYIFVVVVMPNILQEQHFMFSMLHVAVAEE